MCGIIGISSNYLIKDQLIKCLKNLEYRGYDSVGIYLNKLVKTIGRVSDLEKILNKDINDVIGIGHSRWATHGSVTNENAHPFISYHNNFVLVHNGIINNYLEIKEELLLNNYKFNSDTDSEVIVNLLEYYYLKEKDSLQALKMTIKRIKGTYALGIINLNEKDTIYYAKNESPLIIGIHDDYNFIVSDINSSYFLTDKFIILDDLEYGYITNKEVNIFKDNQKINKKIKTIQKENKNISKENYEHYMLKEIHDEPIVLNKLLNKYTLNNHITISDNLINDINKSDEIIILGCGTSYHAGLIGKEIIEKLVNKKVNVILASEFNNHVIFSSNVTYLLLSQSGETIDLKLAYNQIKDKSKIYTFTNVLTSSLATLAKETFDLCCDYEIAVASTKAYVSEVTLLIMIAYKLKNLDEEFILNIHNCINSILLTLNKKELIYEYALKIKDSLNLYYLGRGIDHLINLESSLKLKEISYIHSEAFYGGELKHGSIALISKDTNVFALISNKKNLSSLLNNIKEVESRNANVYLISTSNLNIKSSFIIDLTNEYFAPIVVAPFYQLISYYVALLNNKDIDKPRNLAKSCTVE